jgi:hypothetical protein
MQSLSHVPLVANALGDKGATRIAEILKDNRTISAISLQNNDITDAGAMALAEALEKRTARLETLLLDDNKISDEGACKLVSCSHEIYQLGLGYNKEISKLSVFAAALKCKKSFCLALNNTGITDASIVAFFSEHKIEIAQDQKLECHFYENKEISRKTFAEFKKQFKGSAIKLYHKRIDLQTEYEDLVSEVDEAACPTQELLDKIKKIENEEIREEIFELLVEKFFEIVKITPDGNCLFEAIAKASGKHDHKEWRKRAVSYVREHASEFESFISEDEVGRSDITKVETYCRKMEQPTFWGGQNELIALTGGFGEPDYFKHPIYVLDLNYLTKIIEGSFIIVPHLQYGNDFAREAIWLHRINKNHYQVLKLRKMDSGKRKAAEISQEEV